MITDAQKANPWPLYILLLLSCFITIEASAFQAPAIPAIAREFGITAGLGALIMLTYYLAVVACSPIGGKLADIYGRKKVMLSGLCVFICAELLAAMTPGFEVLLVARFFQGLGVACILPVVLSFVAYLFPAEKRGMPLGVLVFAMSLGATTGSMIGGLLIDNFGWRSIYWISAGLAMAGMALLAVKAPETPCNHQHYRLDWAGTLLLLITVAALLSVPSWISQYGFTSMPALLALGAGALGFVALWHLEQRIENPVLDISILRRRSFFVPSLIYLLLLICYGGTIYALTFFIHDRPGGNASQVGLITMCAYTASMLAGLASGKLVDRFNEKQVILAVMILLGIGLFMYSQLTLQSSIWAIAAVVIVLGAAQGMKGPAITKLALNTVPADRLSMGSGMFSMMRDFGTPAGASIGLSLYGATLTRGTEDHLLERAANLGVDEQWFSALSQALSSKGKDVAPALQEHLHVLGTSFSELLGPAKLEGMATTLSQVGSSLYVVIVLAVLLVFALPGKRFSSAG